MLIENSNDLSYRNRVFKTGVLDKKILISPVKGTGPSGRERHSIPNNGVLPFLNKARGVKLLLSKSTCTAAVSAKNRTLKMIKKSLKGSTVNRLFEIEISCFYFLILSG